MLLSRLVPDFQRFLLSRLVINRRPLIDRGFGLIYDVERDITWLKDANYARTVGRSPDGQLTWNAAMSWVTSLSYRGIRGWRLPSALNPDGSGPCVGYGCDRGELGHLVFGPWTTHPNSVTYLNANPYAIYWTSTETPDGLAYAFDFFNTRQGTLPKDPFATPPGDVRVPLSGPVLSWPVHNGDVASMILERAFKFVVSALARLIGR